MGIFNSIFGKKKKELEIEEIIATALFNTCCLYDTLKYITFLERKIGELPDKDINGLDIFLQSLAIAVVIYSITNRYQERSEALAKVVTNTTRDKLNNAGQKEKVTDAQLQLAKTFYITLQEKLTPDHELAFIDTIQTLEIQFEIQFHFKWEKLEIANAYFHQWAEFFIKEITSMTLNILKKAEDDYGFKPHA